MQIEWQELQVRAEDISKKLMEPSLDPQKRQELQKEFSRLSSLLVKYNQIKELELQQAKSQEYLEKEQDSELISLFQEELEQSKKEQQRLKIELEELLFPPNPLDDRSVFVEIRAGTGGQEAALFAADLMKMYTNYGLTKHWAVSLMDMSETDLGGIREAILHIKGKRVYAHLKYEAGVHRVQRVPRTETQGRVHTSTATVAILPEAEEVEITINPDDLRVDTYRSGGAGGQHVNKTESAIRITHIPTGIVVACQDDRSQHKNRAKAMKVLQARILAHQREKTEQEMTQKRREMVGTGERAEKVRTYNFPQNRVTDHQVDLTLNKLDMVIEGDLDDIIQALTAKDRAQRKQHINI